MNLKPTTRIALAWALRCFGGDHVFDRAIRSLRLVEEAVELCQAHKVPKETMHLLIDEVYGRPPGEAVQEIGGVLLTATVYCAAASHDPEDLFMRELLRVLAKPPEHFAQRNKDKIDMGLTT